MRFHECTTEQSEVVRFRVLGAKPLGCNRPNHRSCNQVEDEHDDGRDHDVAQNGSFHIFSE